MCEPNEGCNECARPTDIALQEHAAIHAALGLQAGDGGVSSAMLRDLSPEPNILEELQLVENRIAGTSFSPLLPGAKAPRDVPPFTPDPTPPITMPTRHAPHTCPDRALVTFTVSLQTNWRRLLGQHQPPCSSRGQLGDPSPQLEPQALGASLGPSPSLANAAASNRWPSWLTHPPRYQMHRRTLRLQGRLSLLPLRQ